MSRYTKHTVYFTYAMCDTQVDRHTHTHRPWVDVIGCVWATLYMCDCHQVK